MVRKAILSICFFFSFSFTFAFVFTNFNSLNGLSNDNSFQMIQDREGFMWVATAYGLNKIGPNGIKRYYKSNGLTNNMILSLDIDDDGKLWIGTAFGLCAFENGNIITKYAGDIVYRPSQLIVGSRYIYWVSVGSLYYIERSTGKVSSCFNTQSEQQIPEGAVRSICRSNDGSVLLATYRGYYVLDEDHLRAQKISGLEDSSFYKVFMDAEKNVWLTTNNSIYKIHGDTVAERREFPGLDQGRINQLYVDAYGKIWYSGISTTPFSFLLYKDVSRNINEILNSNSVVQSYTTDRNGDMWITTFGRGVFYVKNKPYQYYGGGNGLTNTYITDVSSTGSKLYIGTSTSFHYLEENEDVIREFKVSGNNSGTEYIRNICSYGNNFLASVANQSLPPYGRFETTLGTGIDSICFFTGRYVFGDYERRTVMVDHYDDYLTAYTGENGNFIFSKRLDKGKLLGKNASVNTIRCINDRYYVCTVKGLLNCGVDLSDPKVLISGYSVSDVIEYRNRILIAGEFGIIMYSQAGGKIYHFKDFDDQYFLAVRFCVDGNDRLWISTENGIYLFDKNRFNHLGSNDGFSSIHINNFEYQAEGNIMWLASYDGIIAVYLDQLRNDFYRTPRFMIEEVVSGNRTYSYTAAFPRTLEKRELQIRTAFFNSYQLSKSFHLRYKINDGKWNYVNGNTLNMSNLHSGDQSIVLQASEYGYVWSEPVKYEFYIRPFWYEMAGVRIGLGICIILLLVSVILWIVYAVNRKANRRIAFERNVTDLKLQALNAAINSHFVFNVLNAIQYFVSSNQQLKASRFIADFAKFMRIIIDNSNLTIIPISEEIRRIHLYIGLEMMRFEDRLAYTVNIAPSINQDEIMIPNMIIQPFVENSILHGILSSRQKGLIEIDIYDKDDRIHIRIRDNGIGINAARSKKRLFGKKSIGLKNVFQRLELFSGRKGYTYSIIDLSDRNETGTQVDIEIPRLTFSELDK